MRTLKSEGTDLGQDMRATHKDHISNLSRLCLTLESVCNSNQLGVPGAIVLVADLILPQSTTPEYQLLSVLPAKP